MHRLRIAALLVSAGCALAGCAQPLPSPAPPDAQATPINTMPVTSLPGWTIDHTSAALATLVRGCKALAIMPADQSLGGAGPAAAAAGQAGLWQNTCQGAQDVPPGDDNAARQYFAAYFTAARIDGPATITGYFEPEYPGSKNLARGYRVPVYAKPDDATLAALPRAAIDRNALYRKAPVTAYLSNPVDAYMLQSQGAGRILLPDGRTLRVGYDGQNGAPYTAIGAVLVADGNLAADAVSFQSISAWLKAHPAEARGIMEQNANYVYLRPLGALPDDEGAPGALGVPLTAGRSLAIDTHDLPLGLPVFLVTTDPLTGAPLDRLAIAQDTDTGAHDASTVDLFFGGGPEAEAIASRMRQPGALYILLPRPPPTS
jgi:membrane-bound lytic murein transglycosylase A